MALKNRRQRYISMEDGWCHARVQTKDLNRWGFGKFLSLIMISDIWLSFSEATVHAPRGLPFNLKPPHCLQSSHLQPSSASQRPLQSPNLLQWQSSQLPGYASQLELLDLGWENGANISALDASSRHRARPHCCSWSVASSKDMRLPLIATCYAP